MSPVGRVIIIGAGPGDPGLLSVRGLRVLQAADVVVYDRNVESLLRWARPDAERIQVGAPAEREMAQDAISMLLAEKAREGHTVARLKWGDAYVFDSGAKEAMFLNEQGIPFEVVPGIPAAIGASAYAGVPVTYPGGGDALVLLRGQEGTTGAMPDVDWKALAHIDGTLVCYAGGRLAARVLESLIAAGAPADRQAVLISDGTLPTQSTITGTLTELLASTSGSPESNAAILVVGDVVSLREHLRWFDRRPLFGRRIVVTRSREQAHDLVEALESLGAQAIEAPTARLAPPEDTEAIERAAASIGSYQWVVVDSAGAVARLLNAILRGPRDLRAMGGVSVCAIGPSTAERLASHGLKADLVLPESRADGVADAIAAKGPLTDQRVLVVRPDHLRDVLAADLTHRGAIVTDLVAYRTVPEAADSPVVQELYGMLLQGRIDAVTFTSATAVGRFAALIGQEQAADLLNTTVVAAIGPVTAAAASEMGIRVSVVPETYTVDGLVAALVKHFEPGVRS